jgi:putative spermidine/putrescine transport system permease protein
MTDASAADRWRVVFSLSPVLAIYCSLYLGGLVLIGLTSVGFYSPSGNITLGYYGEVFTSPAISATVARTLRVSLATVLICLAIGFPVARYISSATGRMRGLVLMCVLSPLLVSSIGRIFGWISLFGPGSAIASLSAMLFGTKPTGLLYTEVAMVIGMSNLFLPFMVLSIAAAMAHLDLDLPKAAASLGARPVEVFLQIELPMSMPGIVGGVITVLCLSISNFATAALLGGSGRNVVAYEIYLDMLVYFQQERGAALAVLLLATVTILLTLALRLSKRRW